MCYQGAHYNGIARQHQFHDRAPNLVVLNLDLASFCMFISALRWSKKMADFKNGGFQEYQDGGKASFQD